MDVEELAGLIGEPAEELRRWQRLGLLGEPGEDVGWESVERARLVQFAARRGVRPDEVARICSEQGDMLEPFVRWGLAPDRGTIYTRAEAAQRSGLDSELLDRVWAAAGLRDQTHAYEEDIETLRMVTTAMQFGLPLEALLQILRVFADAFGKVSDAATRVFHLYVHERFRAEGLRGTQLMSATQAVADPMTGLVEPAVMYFHRKSWERANREDMVLHLIEESTTPGELVRTILFVDLSSFTPMTEAMGDEAADEVVQRFSEMVRETAAARDGQVIKQIGDEFMLVFSTAIAAVDFGVAVEARAASEPRFPALRLGAHSGAVLYREGDYYGGTVNLAARVTSAADRSQFLVTGAIQQQITERDSEIELIPVAARVLKGVSEPLPLFEVRSATRSVMKSVDPVCGMGVADGAAEAFLTWQGQRLVFCSEDCLRRFLQSPQAYGVVAGNRD
jgi:adenylate cyclase